jgi:hypothetical protein
MRKTIQLTSKGSDVAYWQRMLNIKVDGIFGSLTDLATKAFQRENGIEPDGVVGPLTWSLVENGVEMATLPGFAGIKKLSGSDQKELVETAKWIGIDPYWLASVIKFETIDSFDPAVKNRAGSGATGLIQFMPDTAARLLYNIPANIKTTQAQKDAAIKYFENMSFKVQMQWVRKYYAPYRGKLKSLEDTYLVVFYPALIGTPDNTSIRDTAYAQNKGFDFNSDGLITKYEITSTIRSVYNQAMKLDPITVPIVTMTGLLATAGGIFGAYKLYQMKDKG